MSNNELYHYGILGMKWGVRRTERQLAKARGKVSELEDELKRKTGGKSDGKDLSPDTAPKKKKLSEMSDDELRSRLNRLNMEKQYKEFMDGGKDRDKAKKGESFVGGVLKTAGKNIATQAVAYGMGRLVNAVFSRMAGEKVVDPKNIQKKK